MIHEALHSHLQDASDAIIAGRAADGDVDAFGVLVRRYTPMMRAYARRILPGTTDLDDVVQEAFIAAWQKLPDLENPSKVKSWLMRIVGHKSISRVRSTRRVEDIDDLDVSASPVTAPPRIVEGRARLTALGEVLDELPAAQRECWLLREVSEYSYEEIAEQMQLPVSTVRGLLARARKYILVQMEQWR